MPRAGPPEAPDLGVEVDTARDDDREVEAIEVLPLPHYRVEEKAPPLADEARGHLEYEDDIRHMLEGAEEDLTTCAPSSFSCWSSFPSPTSPLRCSNKS